MKLRSPVLQKLAELYEDSVAGRHGEGKRDFQPDFIQLMQAAGCSEGDAHELAERDLRVAEDAGLLVLEYDRPRVRTSIFKVRLPVTQEQAFYDAIGRPSPRQIRAEWAQLFDEVASWPVPSPHANAWLMFCRDRAFSALNWRGLKPFERAELAFGRELLTLVPRLLAWEGRHLVRWASSVLCGDSKWLERRQKTVELLLSQATGGVISNLETLGILPVPPGVNFHGPLRMRIGSEWRDYRDYHGPTVLSAADIARITAVECTAVRCLTVENLTPFRSLVTLGSGELLVHTSYPNEATLGLLKALARSDTPPEFWHFGDSDPKGFHILADLRARSGISFRAFHMRFRTKPDSPPLSTSDRDLVQQLLATMPAEQGELASLLKAGCKGDFEQESLRPPVLDRWPFYPAADDVQP